MSCSCLIGLQLLGLCRVTLPWIMNVAGVGTGSWVRMVELLLCSVACQQVHCKGLMIANLPAICRHGCCCNIIFTAIAVAAVPGVADGLLPLSECEEVLRDALCLMASKDIKVTCQLPPSCRSSNILSVCTVLLVCECPEQTEQCCSRRHSRAYFRAWPCIHGNLTCPKIETLALCLPLHIHPCVDCSKHHAGFSQQAGCS